MAGEAPARPAPIPTEAILAARNKAAAIHLAPALKDYIVRLVMATRKSGAMPEIEDKIEHAVSPRGSLALAAAARARAFLAGRDYAVPEDVSELAPDILSHRVIPTWRASAEGITGRSLVARLVERVEPL